VKRALAVVVLVVAVVVGAGALSASRACAHDPRFACSPRDARPVVVDDVQKSWAFYGRLNGDTEDRYEIRTSRPTTVPVQLLVDQRDAGNPARPFAVVAAPSGREIAELDLTGGRSFFEPFSRVTYLASAPRQVTFPAGTSWITVTMLGGADAQRYTLAVGSDERFSIWEIPYLAGAVYRIHERLF